MPRECLRPATPLKAIWLDRHNPVVSANYRDAGDTLKNMEFVVLQNLFMTKTAQFAHVVLPVAAYGEEEVTFTSTERRSAARRQGDRTSLRVADAWQQVTAVANRMGASWRYSSVDDVHAEIAATIPDYEAVKAENLARDYGRQWPCTRDRPLGTPRLFGEDRPLRFSFENIRFAPQTKHPARTTRSPSPSAIRVITGTRTRSLPQQDAQTRIRHLAARLSGRICGDQ